MNMINDIKDAMAVLFQVWEGTENADEILQDVARTIGHRVFQLEGQDLNRWESECRGVRYDDAVLRENETLQRRQGKLPRE